MDHSVDNFASKGNVTTISETKIQNTRPPEYNILYVIWRISYFCIKLGRETS